MTRLAAQKQLKELLAGYYSRLAKRDKPVAWCTSVGPAELLRSFGYEVYFPENHGALIGAKRLGSKYIPMANQAGYSADICSYLTSDIGAYKMGETPLQAYGLEEIPRADLLVYNTSQCMEVKEWFSYYQREWDVPLLGIQTPRDLDGGGDDPALHAYLKAHWLELIKQLESISGKSFDEERFAQVTAWSHQACSLWQDFLETNAGGAAHHTFFDHIILMAPVVVMRGEQEAVEFYRALNREVADLPPADGKNRLRVYWEGMPLWGKIRYLAEFFAKHRVDVVASTYCHSWTFDFSGDDPLDAMVRAYSGIFISQSQDWKLDYLKNLATRFDIDAAVFHDAKTCPHNTNSRFAIPHRFQEETGIPAVTVYGDLVDLRHFSGEEFTLRLEAQLEQLSADHRG